MQKRFFCLVGIGVIAMNTSAWAQGGAGPVVVGPVVAAPIQNWNYMNHSSTFTEGALRGQAAVVSAAGELVYFDSLAAVNYAEASRRWIDNSVAATRAIYERRAIREEYLEKYGPKPFVGEARKRALDAYLPKRLSAEDFDPKLGRISWPHVLRQSQYEPIVAKINQIFSTRKVDNSGDGSTTQMQIGHLSQSLRGLLRENISHYSAAQYLDSLEFIRSVDLESKSTVLAINNVKTPSVEIGANAGIELPVNVTSKPAKSAD